MKLSDLASLFNNEVEMSDVTFESVSTDTRTIEPGALFVALRGDNFDGHDYLELAAEKGAVAAIVDCESDAAIPLIKTEDTRLALGKLAAYWRQQLDLKVIGLTGSNGKTTVKEMLTSIFSEVGNVTSTAGNFNNDIGLPLTLLKIKPEHEYAVIEMGANHKNEIAYLTDLTRPDVALLNNAGPAHLEGFGSLQGVAEAKAEIFSGLDATGIAVINRDDQFAEYWLSVCSKYKTLSFGLSETADVTTKINEADYSGLFELNTPVGEIDIKLNVLGIHNLKNALAASAVAVACGVGLQAIQSGLKNFYGVKGRLQLNKAANDSLVIDDSYNANPSSVRAAIDVLSAQKMKSILVLGDMGELGENAAELHAELGRYAKEKNIDQLMTLGDLSSYAAKNFGENGLSFKDKKELIKVAKKQLKEKVAVLVKGSRGMHMEDVVAALTENNSGATSCC